MEKKEEKKKAKKKKTPEISPEFKAFIGKNGKVDVEKWNKFAAKKDLE